MSNKILSFILGAIALSTGCVVDSDPSTFGSDPFTAPERSGEIEQNDSPAADLPIGAVDPGPCEPGIDHIACPGNECAHGACFVGECMDRVVDAEGFEVDPGVCCTDDTCDAE